MPTLISVTCINCKKHYSITLKRYNESLKKGWNFYCSPECRKEFRKTGKLLTCDNPDCSSKFYRAKCFINETGNFCSQSCAASINNNLRKKELSKICANPSCDNKIPPRNTYCSNKCRGEVLRKSESYYKEKTLKGINDFVRSHGRIPLKVELPSTYTFSRKGFGTWNKAIKAAGHMPNPILFARKHIALDGHVCDSFSEMIIDNWLYSYSIPHKINVHYPKNSKLTTDFVVGDYWIEFFGLAGDLIAYDKNVQRKLRIAKDQNLELIKLYPKDLYPKNILEKTLQPVLYHYAKAFVFV